MGEILLGTSGWHYKDWVGPVYRDEKKSKLAAYSGIFKTAEIDSTFYRYPSKGMVMGWLKYTKPDFIFTAKLPKLITHEKKLDLTLGAEADLQNFCDLMRPLLLDGKLGCLLIQLPPKFRFNNLECLKSFFKILPKEFSFAVEFRDLSWIRNETWKLLAEHEVAYTIVDEPLLPPEVKVTSKIAYVRWHGRGGRPWYNYRYRAEELDPWVPKVRQVAKKTKTVFGYFNNHYHGYAVENCLQVLEMLGVSTPEQVQAKVAVSHYLKALPEKKQAAIETFVKPAEMPLRRLLLAFMDKERLKRAERIDDKDIKIQDANESVLKASVRDYHIVIDSANRVILHDCADWSRCIPEKRLCKHLAKLMLSLPEDKSKSILRKILSEKDAWEFKPYAE
jgi:uncharacterized protein YecE (DUF72 family)